MIRLSSIFLLFIITSKLFLVAQNEPLTQDPEQQAYEYAYDVLGNALRQKNKVEQREEFRLAADLFRRYTRKFPNHKNTPWAKYYLGYCYTKTAKLNNARLVYSNIVETYKTGPFVLKAANYLAFDSSLSKNFEKAMKYYGVVVALSEGGEEKWGAIYSMGESALMLKKEEKAEEYFQKTLKLAPLTSQYRMKAHMQLGYLNKKKLKYKEALEHFNLVATEKNGYKFRIESNFLKGVCSYHLQNYKEATKAFRKVILIGDNKWVEDATIYSLMALFADSDYAGVVREARFSKLVLRGDLMAKKEIFLGKSYLKLKEYRMAIDTFNKVISRFPKSKWAFESGYRKILCYYNLQSELVDNQVNLFIRQWGEKYSKHEYMHSALLLQAETFFDKESYAAAARVYEQIDQNLISIGNQMTVDYKRAWSYSEMGESKKAVNAFSKFLNDYPKDPRVLQSLNVRAKNYAVLGDKLKAIEDYEKVILLAKETPLASSALQSVARLYKDAGEYDKMISRYESLVADSEDLPNEVTLNAWYWCAWGNFKAKNYERTVLYLEKAGKIDNGDYRKLLCTLEILCFYQLKNKDSLLASAKKASAVGIANDIPMGIYRWLGSQCFRAEEFADAQTFFSLGVTKLAPEDTPVIYWRMLAKCQYENKHYQWALQSIKHALDFEKDEAHRVDMHLYEALCQLGLNKPELAKNTAIQVLKKNPSGRVKAMSLKLLGDIYFKEQNYREATISFFSVTDFYEDDEILPYSIAMMVKALKASNKPSDAAEFEARLKKNFPKYKIPE